MTTMVLDRTTEGELQLQMNRTELKKLQKELDELLDELRQMLNYIEKRK
jgi:hypothetical protein